MKKGLLALQYYHGDREKAGRLAKLIAALEREKRRDVEFLLVARHDTKHDPATVAALSRKFDVHTHITPTPARGHPWAAWVVWHSIAEWVNAQPTSYRFVFTFEADCVPISRNWINEISEAWDEANAFVVGAETFHHEHHINGNMMYSGSPIFVRWILNTIGRTGVPLKKPWDIHLFPRFVQWGVHFSKRIWNSCGAPTFKRSDYTEAQQRGVSIVHGCKDDSLFNMVKEDLLGNS